MDNPSIHFLLIDNYDSFTHNLAHLFLSLPNVQIDICKNNDIVAIKTYLGKSSDKTTWKTDGVIIGPGPGSPEDGNYFGYNKKIITNWGVQGLPILGICLGFQGIIHAFGGKLKIATLPMHGKTSQLDIIKDDILFKNIPNKINVMRYHSLMVSSNVDLPKSLLAVAWTCESESSQINGRELMALRHKDHNIYGLQFHPESFATEKGYLLANNFLKVVQKNMISLANIRKLNQ